MNGEKDEPANPLGIIYTLGLLCWTAIFYSQDGFWVALGKSLLWPVWLGILIYDRVK